MTQIKAGRYALISPKIRPGTIINVMLIKKTCILKANSSWSPT